MARSLLRSLVVFLFAGFATLSWGQIPALSLQVSAQSEGAFVASPGQSVELSVVVRNAAGIVQANRVVRFGAPLSGASGIFSESTASNKTWIDTRSDAGGLARARFTVGPGTGVFSVDAVVADSTAGVSFAFSVLAAAPTTRSTANEVRSALRTSVLANAVDSNLVRLYGPFLLPAGTRISPAIQGRSDSPRYPRALTELAWFAWIDDAPESYFGHPTRFVEMPASAAASSAAQIAVVSEQAIFPTVLLPASNETTSLLGGLATNYLAGGGSILGFTPLKSPVGPRQATAEETCVFAGFGPGAKFGAGKGARQDMLDLALQFAKGIPQANVFTPVSEDALSPLSRQDIQDAMEELKKRGCKKVIFIFVGHGTSAQQGAGIVLQAPAGSSSQYDLMSYDDLAVEFKKLGDAEVCIVINACFSGQALPFFQGIGLNGGVMTTASVENLAWAGVAGDSFVPALEKTGNDLEKTVEEVKKSGTSEAKGSDPQYKKIVPNGARGLDVPYLTFESAGLQATISLRRPAASNPASTVTEIFTSTNPSIGTIRRLVDIPAGASQATTEANSFLDGFTPVVGDANEVPGGIAYSGKGGIQVGTFKVTKPVCRQFVTATCVFEIERYGVTDQADKGDVFTISQSDESVATVASLISMARAEKKRMFPVVSKGKAGTTTVRVTRNSSGASREVAAAFFTFPLPSSSIFAFTDGLVRIYVKWLRLTNFHDCCYNPTDGLLSFIFGMGGALTINGDGRTTPTTSTGSYNPTTGSFSATGSMRVSSFNTSARIEGTINAKPGSPRIEFQTITMQLKVGVNGDLPGGGVELVNGTGTVEPTCSYEIDKSTLALSRDENFATLDLVTGTGCAWTAAKTGDFLSLASATSGSGPTKVLFEVTANRNAGARTATIGIGGKTLTITQAGVPTTAPTITEVVNGASFGAGITSSSWVTISGTNLAAADQIWGSADFSGDKLPTRLGDTTVTIGGLNAFVYFISPRQLNVLAPDGLAAGFYPVIVKRGSIESNRFSVYVRATSPGLFLFDAAARRYVAAVNADGVFAGKPNLYQGLVTRPPVRGDVVLLYATGFGPTLPATPADRLVAAPAPTASGVVIRIGGKDAAVLFAGKISSGLFQFNVRIPELTSGDHEVEIWIDGVKAQAGAYLTIG